MKILIFFLENRISYLDEKGISELIKNQNLRFSATSEITEAIKNISLSIISLPTNFDESKNCFDTSIIEGILEDLDNLNVSFPIFIKSTIPIGFTRKMNQRFHDLRIYFSPEFIREGSSVYDNQYPSRVIVGSSDTHAREFVNLISEVAIKTPKILHTNNDEAEAIKLFSNTYLATRVAFFNEVDSFSRHKGLNSKEIIEGISLDNRIGNHYNNPSFGYGGYCLPKDTKQIIAQTKGMSSKLIESVNDSNAQRKKFITKEILYRNPKKIGIYRLTMKNDSDNFREAAILDIIELLTNANKEIIIYEPLINADQYNGLKVEKSMESFLNACDIVVANRKDSALNEFEEKVYTCDLFGGG